MCVGGDEIGRNRAKLPVRQMNKGISTSISVNQAQASSKQSIIIGSKFEILTRIAPAYGIEINRYEESMPFSSAEIIFFIIFAVNSVECPEILV